MSSKPAHVKKQELIESLAPHKKEDLVRRGLSLPMDK